MTAWKITLLASRDVVQAALLAHEELEQWDQSIVIAACELAEDRPLEWRLDAYLERRPTAADRRAIAALFGNDAPAMHAEPLPQQDWVTLSQAGVDPVHAGRFCVHTPDHAPEQLAAGGDRPAIRLVIPASQAFGTGQHHTTAGCLEMLDLMKREGVIARNIADIGTGTGLLAFAAMALWPRALATASDIDDVCLQVVLDNAALNHVSIGEGPGRLVMTIATGMESPILASRTPYDLLIANILAGPLVDLAADFGRAVVPGGNLLLAGLLTTQEQGVQRAAFRSGFRLARRIVRGDWSVLWLRKRGVRPFVL
ncbi:50S ribosomal protein L11 methyltransferase [Croceicoccus sp. F390]|uniref:Ribosomal protein L11 methyltransferase n=1 Tax=Croceicoccus esteveae TaxID=3075597 RepID=A0ABU2ZE44_9SPHN|nr:50S ribosomal protein L11 methyltransferase [Croceicoccus sp. F390]MDT0574873.1 50S ribosomal protein L11 methyltransferase [Croceicoccus sp. F390]